MRTLFKVLLLWLIVLPMQAADALYVRIGDKLTLLINGEYAVYYVQGFSPERTDFIVYSFKSQSQYYMTASFLEKYVVKVERRTEVIYLVKN